MSSSLQEVFWPCGGLLALHWVARTYLDRTRRWVRAAVICVAFLVCWRYLYWRATATLPEVGLSTAYVLAALFFALELISEAFWQNHFARAALGWINRSASATQQACWYGQAPPLVDILVPTYNENLSVLERTLVLATAIRYPNFRVWVLDDGKREWVDALSRRLGVGYLRRDSSSGYKAGNLNHALRVLKRSSPEAEFIAIFDADFVPRQEFLTRTMALMADERIALVQTPQQFFNPDAIQYAFGAQHQWPDDLRFIFSVLLVGWDAAGGSSCCGTSFLVRRRAIEAIGGFPTESVTEDLLTAVKLGEAGLECAYLNETLSVGLAAESLVEHLSQRSRWVLGAAQVARRQWRASGRPWSPRNWLAFCDLGVRPGLMALHRQLFLLVPALSLLSGTVVVHASLADTARFVLPVAVVRCSLSWLTAGAILPVFSHVMSILPDPVVLRANISGLVRPGARPFAVTDKGWTRQGLRIHRRLLAYFLCLLLLTLGGLANAIATSSIASSSSHGFIVIWSLYNLVILTLACVPCFELPKHRQSERYACQNESAVLQLDGRGHPIRLLDLGPDGVAVAGLPLEVGTRVGVTFEDLDEVFGRVVRRRDDGGHAIAFDSDSPQRHALLRKIFAADRYIRPALEWRLSSAAGQLFVWGMKRGKGAFRKRHSALRNELVDASPIRGAPPARVR